MLSDEKALTFAEAAKWLAERHGRKVTACTVWRWARVGVRGVKLESRLLGGLFITSVQALDRFGQTLAESAPEPRKRKSTQSKPGGRTAKQRENAIARAEARLERAGVR